MRSLLIVVGVHAGVSLLDQFALAVPWFPANSDHNKIAARLRSLVSMHLRLLTPFHPRYLAVWFPTQRPASSANFDFL